MKLIKRFLRVLFTPNCWVTVGVYSRDWDRKLRSLMDRYDFTERGTYTAKIGPVQVWIESHPYASFKTYRYFGGELVNGPIPKRATMLEAMDKLNRDTIPAHDDQTVGNKMTDETITKPLFVYLKGSKNVPVKKIEAAGYVCVPVDSLDSFEIITPVAAGVHGIVTQCAYETLMGSFPTKEKFGNKVLKALAPATDHHTLDK